MSIVRAGALGGASWLRNEVRRAATCWLVFGPWGTRKPGSTARGTFRSTTHATRTSSMRLLAQRNAVGAGQQALPQPSG